LLFRCFVADHNCWAKRLLKEVSYYEKEAKENDEKLKEMKDQNKNPFDIKKFGEVLEESLMMIPDSKNRLEQALIDLETYLQSEEIKELAAEISNDEWYVKASALLEENSSLLTGTDDNENVVEYTDVSGLAEGEEF